MMINDNISINDSIHNTNININNTNDDNSINSSDNNHNKYAMTCTIACQLLQCNEHFGTTVPQ